ncbi:MAG: GntR family transcriptional regulator [Chloroflexi bacterium]|nr:GntR family transcriptional regulator [Chloroflexota bacterium]
MSETIHPFQRLTNMLAALIAETPPGERLPSEPDLARSMGVSRATLREAMRSFEGQGLIRRRQGVGTFVVGRSQIIESGLEVLESIEALANRIQLDVAMGALHVTQVKADAFQAAQLNCQSGDPLIEVSRVILADNRPVAYLVDLLPEDVLSPSDLSNGFTGSVLDLLLQRGELQLAQSRTEIRAVAASAELARALQIQRSDVLLLFVAFLYTTAGRVVDYSLSYFLPGYFRFHVVRSVGFDASIPRGSRAREEEIQA